MRGLLNVLSSWQDVLNHINDTEKGTWEWLSKVLVPMSTVLWVLLILVGAAGSIYAVYVGVKMARAESQEQRDENKKRLINIIVSIVVVIVLIVFFNTLLPMILDAFKVFDKTVTDPSAGQSIVNTARVFLH